MAAFQTVHLGCKAVVFKASPIFFGVNHLEGGRICPCCSHRLVHHLDHPQYQPLAASFGLERLSVCQRL
ncbi:hypothetical protein RB213_010954 [Colletotrichum asianum]